MKHLLIPDYIISNDGQIYSTKTNKWKEHKDELESIGIYL